MGLPEFTSIFLMGAGIGFFRREAEKPRGERALAKLGRGIGYVLFWCGLLR